MNNFKKLVLLLSIAMVAGGSKACREDYCVACKATVGTTTPTETPTGTITPTTSPTGTVSPTGTPTVTPTGTLSPSPTPTETIDPDVEETNFLRKLSKSSNIKRALVATDTVNPKSSNWLGNIDNQKIDSDGDGFADWFEKENGSDSSDMQSIPSIEGISLSILSQNDADRDGVSDQDEMLLGTDPNVADTDQDGCSDGSEYLSGTNPRIKDSVADDDDGDCLSNEIEKQLGTNPNNRDSDGDRLSDSLEVSLDLNPLDPDTDFNGIFDWKQAELSASR